MGGEQLENSDYIEEANDFEAEVTIDTTHQEEEGETVDPMETEITIPLDMEDEAFYYCAGYVHRCSQKYLM